MSFALAAGVTGLQAHQKMIDIAGNNLANVNTTAFKASRIVFSELLSETIKKASQPTSTVGGTNPQQMGHGVGVAGITPNMAQGNIVNTGNPLDLAIEGEGYFVTNDGEQDLYTRAGAFAVDANSRLVDPSTGNIVQRIGTIGESDGFQIPGDTNVRVPFDVSMPARASTEVRVSGNLSADAALAEPQTNALTSNIIFTTGGAPAGATAKISELDQYTATTWADGTLTFSGYKPDGTALASATPTVDLTMAVNENTTIQDVLDYLNTDEGTAAVKEVQTVTLATAPNNDPDGGHFHLTYGGETTGEIAWDATTAQIKTALEGLSTIGTGNIDAVSAPMDTGITITFADTFGDADLFTMDSTALLDGAIVITNSIAETTKGRAVQGVLGSDATATLINGKLRITDAASGYSQSDFKMAWSDTNLTVPAYFEVTTVGGDEIKNINITVYDSQGGKHVLAGAFVRTDTANMWDMILTSISGDITEIAFDNRRINGMNFYANNGSFKGLDETIADTADLAVTFAHDISNPQTISMAMGTTGQFDGLTQFKGNSTAVAREQDGYAAGSFSAVSVNNEGIFIGVFTNGIKKDLAAMKLALFQNSSALETVGNGYFIASANSGEAVATQALTGGAGSVHGGALEKSNSDVANEFVSMIQAQNGFQANAKTIKIANDILRDLTNLIR
jgi:flagellar hook protein FlgE